MREKIEKIRVRRLFHHSSSSETPPVLVVRKMTLMARRTGCVSDREVAVSAFLVDEGLRTEPDGASMFPTPARGCGSGQVESSEATMIGEADTTWPMSRESLSTPFQ